MQSKATLTYLRIAPRKVRLVAELIRGKKVSEAQTILRFSAKSAAGPLDKLLRSALAAMARTIPLKEENLTIAEVAVQAGAKLKRYWPRARGRAYPIEKKTSHITLVVREIIPTTQEKKVSEDIQGPQRVAESDYAKLQKTEGGATKPKLKPVKEMLKPKIQGGLQRIFRRKAM